MSETLISKSGLVSKLIKNKKFRDSYCFELIRTGTSFQMRALREDRGWTQADLAQATGKPRSVITRLESPKYGKLSLTSLLEIASGFDVALLVKFVPFSRLVQEYDDLSPQTLSAKSVTDKEEIEKLESWASGQNVDLLASLKRQAATGLRSLDEPVSTSAVQHTLVFSSPELVTQADNSTSNKLVPQPKEHAIAA